MPTNGNEQGNGSTAVSQICEGLESWRGENTMGKRITVHTDAGRSYEVEPAEQDERFYEDLLFSSSNVVATEVRDS